MRFTLNSVYTRLSQKIVGRENELAVILSAIQAKLPVLLVGMPGVSKTTILNAIAEEIHYGQTIFQVTGDEQMTAHSLAGSFDPALVIKDGYKQEYFTFGPLAEAMRTGGILYVEELNRTPSGALNVLMTALSDGYLEIPRFGRVVAKEGFTLIGSSNPADDIGTQRLSRGLADRFVTVQMGFQSEAEEQEIVRRKHPQWSEEWLEFAVYIARASRVHPELRYGASVRGPIAFLDLLGNWDRPSSEQVYACGIAAFLSKIKLKPSSNRTEAEILREIMDKYSTPEIRNKLFDVWKKGANPGNLDSSGGALAESNIGGDSETHKGGAIRESSGPSPPVVAGEANGAGGMRGGSSKKPGELPFMDMTGLVDTAPGVLTKHRERPWVSVQEVERWMDESLLQFAYGQYGNGWGNQRLTNRPWENMGLGDMDVESTLQHVAMSPEGLQPRDIHVYQRQPVKKDFVVFIDHSGSMVGEKLAFSAALAGTLARLGASEQTRYGVYAFDQDVSEVKSLYEERQVDRVVADILRMPEGRSTDLSAAFRFALQLVADDDEIEVVFVSDCMPTRGEKVFRNLFRIVQGIPHLSVCYVNSNVGADFSVETSTGVQKLDLYGWWGYKWAGRNRFFVVNGLSDLGQTIELLLGDKSAVLL